MIDLTALAELYATARDESKRFGLRVTAMTTLKNMMERNADELLRLDALGQRVEAAPTVTLGKDGPWVFAGSEAGREYLISIRGKRVRIVPIDDREA